MPQTTHLIALALILLLLAAGSAVAQQGMHRVSGVVVDSGDGSPLSGVTVTTSSGGGAAQTNGSGRFSLNVPADPQIQLQFRKDGYRSVQKTIDGSTSAVIISMKRGG